ncbi:hypothetical protein J6590_075290 [Homalodisca vitripennis]|nr:hypothetical protein J6590_075290 [Homalodisca vitripennis]
MATGISDQYFPTSDYIPDCPTFPTSDDLACFTRLGKYCSEMPLTISTGFEYVKLQHETSVKNPNGAFVTGVDIFSPEEQAKLNRRAQRFGIEASDAKVLSGKLLKKLYKSMCVKPTDKDIRLEALHMRGTQQMTTQDVFAYFKDYGPASLEWISDNSCNVVWLDEVSAARALLGLSVHISGQPAKGDQALSDSDMEMETGEETDNLSEESDAVPLEDLHVDLPPGRWRRGAPHPLSLLILLRFATTSDRSLPRPGYTKFGSHQFGGYVGLISESRKRRMQNALPAPILFDDVGDEVLPKPSVEETDNANPWGNLAKTWSQFDKVRQPRPPSPMIERILPMPSRMTPPPSPPVFSSRPKLVARTRLRRERERKVSDPGEESSDNEEWRTRSKLPRMRMHADDEERKREQRMKRSHRHRSQSYSPSRRNDLRLRIGTQRNQSDMEDAEEKEQSVEAEDEEVPDLRVAVAADRSASPEDSKAGLRQSLFRSGNVKSVLRGARGHSENDDDDDDDEDEEDESDDTEKVKVSVRRHRSRSRERRKHQRKHRKETHHRSRRKDSDSDSKEKSKTVRSTIRKKSPEMRSQRSEDTRERWTSHEVRERRSPRHKRRRNEEHRKHETDKKSDNRDDRRHRDSRAGRDLRSKIAHSRHKNYDSNNEFRSKSPLQIEIDNDEYYKGTQSD